MNIQIYYGKKNFDVQKAERFFKLSRMYDVQMTGHVADITKEGTRNQSEANLNQQAQQKLPLIQIKAKVSPSKIAYLFDSFVCSDIKQHKDGSITVTFTAPDTDWLIGMLLGFEADIRILSPKRIADAVQQKAKEISQLYRK